MQFFFRVHFHATSQVSSSKNGWVVAVGTKEDISVIILLLFFSPNKLSSKDLDNIYSYAKCQSQWHQKEGELEAHSGYKIGFLLQLLSMIERRRHEMRMSIINNNKNFRQNLGQNLGRAITRSIFKLEAPDFGW
jgi:hypothetical protein